MGLVPDHVADRTPFDVTTPTSPGVLTREGGSPPALPAVARTVASVSVVRLFGVVCYAASSVVTARLIGPAVFGPLTAWIGALALAQVLCDAGMATYSVRELSRDAGWRPFTWFVRIRVTISVLLLVPVVICCSVDRVLGVGGTTAAALLVYLALHCTADVLIAPALAAGRQAAVAVWQATERVVCLPVVLLLGSTGVRGPALPVGMASGALVFAVIALSASRASRRPRVGSPHVAAPEVARRCVHFLTTSLGGQVQNLDVAVVSVVAGSVQAGLYGIPSRLTNPLVLVVASFCTVLFPRLSRQPSASGLRSTLATIRWGTGLAAVAAGLGVVFAGPLLRWTVGPGYSGAVGATRLILVAVTVLTATMPLATVLQAFDRERSVARVIAVSSLVGLPVTALGAAAEGATGAATGWLAGQLLVLVLLLFEIHRLRRSLDA